MGVEGRGGESGEDRGGKGGRGEGDWGGMREGDEGGGSGCGRIKEGCLR